MRAVSPGVPVRSTRCHTPSPTTWPFACYPSFMRFLPLTACALLFALPAKADKFWLAESSNTPANQASTPNFVEGVLLEEADGMYVLRVVGGELRLPKASVSKVEKDGLTIGAIEQAEKAAAEKLALQNRERELEQGAAKKAREIQALEASARRSNKPADVVVVPADAPQAPVFDPVVGVARGVVPSGDLLGDAQLAYELTKDRRYLRVIRQLRRLR